MREHGSRVSINGSFSHKVEHQSSMVVAKKHYMLQVGEHLKNDWILRPGQGLQLKKVLQQSHQLPFTSTLFFSSMDLGSDHIHGILFLFAIIIP